MGYEFIFGVCLSLAHIIYCYVHCLQLYFIGKMIGLEVEFEKTEIMVEVSSEMKTEY